MNKWLLDRARVELPGASDAGIKQMAYEVVKEFFDQSSSWQEDISIAVVPNTTDYKVRSIGPPPGQIKRLLAVLDSNRVPQPAVMRNLDTVKFVNPYSQAQTFTATVILVPIMRSVRECVGTEDTTPAYPAGTDDVWGDVLLDGLLGKMRMQPKKPYSDPTTGVWNLRRFLNGIAAARTAARKQNTYGVQSWRFPQQFAVNGQKGGVSVGNPTTFS